MDQALALLDLDCLDLMRGAASSGIVLSVLVMMSVAVNMIVAEDSGDCVEFAFSSMRVSAEA